MKIRFVVKGAGAFTLLFRLEYKTSVICHTVNTQNVKVARRDRPLILASNRCETFKNPLHIDIAPVRTLSGILHSKKLNDDSYQYQEPMTHSVRINIYSTFVAHQVTARYSICLAQENCLHIDIAPVRSLSGILQ